MKKVILNGIFDYLLSDLSFELTLNKLAPLVKTEEDKEALSDFLSIFICEKLEQISEDDFKNFLKELYF